MGTRHHGVLEAGSDGAFDVDAAVTERATELDLQTSEHLREKGNAAFQSKSFAMAISYYTQAITKNPHNHLLFSNRSAAFLQLKKFNEALEDAKETITLAPKWSKGYSRKALACEALFQWQNALDAYKAIVKLESSCDSAETKKATTKIQQIQQRLAAGSRTTDGVGGAVKKGFFHQPKTKTQSSIYAEKEDIIKPVIDKHSGTSRLENDSERRWRYMLSRLKDGCNKQGVNAKGEKVVLDDGVFAKLLDQHAFQKLIYPGIPSEQLTHAPKNLQELLEDPWYEDELLSLMPKVQAKAQSVLENVKKRGAAQGDVMDAATEQLLLPQILQEAFGREVLAMVHRINYKKHVMLANDLRMVADPAADEASWDQLPDSFLDELFSREPRQPDTVAGVAVLDGFMGEDWISLVQTDAHRMTKNGLLLETVASPSDTLPSSGSKVSDTTSSTSGSMRFLEKTDCDQEYPALAELIEKLHALPFEINAKRPANATLCAQFAHCTALHRLTQGSAQRLRLDCGAGDKDNGFKLTCVYIIHHGSQDGSDNGKSGGAQLVLRTELEVDARVQKISPVADRLVVFQSQRVFNEITTLLEQDEELLYMAFWIHGKALY